MIYILFWIVCGVLVVYAGWTYVQFSKKNKQVADLDFKLQTALAANLHLQKENQELKFQNDTLSKLVLQYNELQQGKIPDQ